METKEYRGFVDKSEWPRGEWDDEPDKVQWRDDATGLPCLIVRGPHGAFCGYVGVSDRHPWHGKGYGSCVAPSCTDRTEERGWCDHTPESMLKTHGGITFASGCHHGTREGWEKTVAALPKWEAESRQFPRGDAARRLKINLPFKDNFDGWMERQQAVGICHIPAPGEPDNVWWFGFDCAHSGDLAPAYDSLNGYDSSYCDLEYVRREVTSLAAQLSRHASNEDKGTAPAVEP